MLQLFLASCCNSMFRVFHMHVSSVFILTHVAIVFIWMLHMFHTYVACVLFGCLRMVAMVFKCVLGVF
jgi:hypothetical protein